MNKTIQFSLVAGALLIALSALGQTATPTATPSISPSTSPMHDRDDDRENNNENKKNDKQDRDTNVLTVADRTCMQNAVNKRDTAIVSAVDKYSTSVKSALTTRRDALKAAWALTDAKESKKARNAAWDMYRKSIKTARRLFSQDKAAAWKQFKIDAKACHAKSGDADNGGEGADNQI